MPVRKLSAAAPRSELIASYAYGVERPYWYLISQADRDKAAASGAAMPDGSYPILSCEGDNSVDTAVNAVGRGSGSHDAIRKHIITRAKSLGCSGKIPDNWNDDGSLQASAPPPPAAKAAPPADPAAADAAVTDAIAKLTTALDAAIAAQKADPDASDPADEKVSAGLDAIAKALAQLTEDQEADAAGDPDAAKPAPAKTPPPVAAAAPPAPKAAPASPVDADGNIDGSAVCANPDCQHLASAHLNDDSAGKNTGACQMTNCSCLAMQIESEPNSGSGDDQGDQGGGGAQPGPQSEELAIAAIPTPPGIGTPSTNSSDLNSPPPVAGSDNMGPAFTIPVAIIEGQPTGDGRQIAPGALSWRTPPLPLMGLATSPHDADGYTPNAPAVVCGRIDSVERQPGEGDTQVIVMKGFYLANDDGMYFADLNEQFGRMGVSGDVAVSQSDMTAEGLDDDGWPLEMTTIVTEGVVMGATAMPGFAAFEGAYIVLGDGADAPAPIPQQDEKAVTAAIHWMSYGECERCEQGLEVITASGAGPVAPPAEWFQDPGFTEGDGRLVEILDRRGQRALGGKYACPLTIEDSGRVYGHLAPWGVCHIGKPGCVTAPQSKSDYAYFKRGQHVVCADGTKIRVGTLTANAGHAGLAQSPAAAMAHYDDIAAGCADVNCGEDEYGIWLAGAIRPTATPEQIAALRASSISGDWRGLGGSLELVAALAVPVPGFPHAVVAGAQEEALVAAGAGVMHRLKHPAPADPAVRRELLDRALLRFARRDARERIAALRR